MMKKKARRREIADIIKPRDEIERLTLRRGLSQRSRLPVNWVAAATLGIVCGVVRRNTKALARDEHGILRKLPLRTRDVSLHAAWRLKTSRARLAVRSPAA